MDEQKKVGVGLVGFGISFSCLGIALFFDRGLLALGNIFFMAGAAILLGWQATWRLFKRNYMGSISFLTGLFLIFAGWPVIGIILEIFGSFKLFSIFWASIQAFLYQIPVIGWLLRFPLFFVDRIARSVG